MVGRYKSGGGTAHVTNDIKNALCQEHEVVTYTFAKVTRFENNKYITPFSFGQLAFLRITGMLLCRMARNCDILIYPNFLFGISGNKQPIIIYNHIGFPMQNTNKYRRISKAYSKMFENVLTTMIQRIKVNKNIHILTNSQYTANLIRERVGREALVINPSVNIDKFTTPITKQRNGVVSIGAISPHKKYPDLCEVMTQIKTPYTIIGKMMLSFEKKHYNMLQAKYPNVHIIPNASEQTMKDKLWTSKVYLHGRIEDFGISIVEAVAAGCIPIVPDGRGIRETIPIQELRFEPGNLDAIREKVNAALSGAYDHYMPELQVHVKQYDVYVFNRKILDYVRGLSSHQSLNSG